ncbi:MAG: hypothetical protein AB7O49_02155 [Sphingomonadales bacterium]
MPDRLDRRTIQLLLDSLEGAAYMVAADGTILAVGGRDWDMFARDNGAPELGRDIAGRNISEFIAGAPVLQVHHELHRQVCSGERPGADYEFRCDTPRALRHMRMNVSPVSDAGEIIAALYHAVLIESRPRPAMDLFGRNPADCAGLPVVTVCSYCNHVSWPVGAAHADSTWISADDYYSRGGTSQVFVSHGICESCFEKVFAATQ